jgi:predicted FMN-binding regulatory protein PaiB
VTSIKVNSDETGHATTNGIVAFGEAIAATDPLHVQKLRDAGESLYRGAIASIVAIRLAVRDRRVKFKLGQNRPAKVRARVVEELRKRGRPNDARAAEALQWTINRDTEG